MGMTFTQFPYTFNGGPRCLPHVPCARHALLQALTLAPARAPARAAQVEV